MSEQENPNWERQVLERLVMTTLKEQRKSRNWSIFFKFAGFAWLFLVLAIIVTWRHGEAPEGTTTGPHTALVDLTGVIAAGEGANADHHELAGIKFHGGRFPWWAKGGARLWGVVVSLGVRSFYSRGPDICPPFGERRGF